MTNKELNKIIALGVIAFGGYDGTLYEYYPTLPKIYSERVKFNDGYADFLRLTIDDDCNLMAWFMDDNEGSFFFPLDKIAESHPLLHASIVTNMFDIVNYPQAKDLWACHKVIRPLTIG